MRSFLKSSKGTNHSLRVANVFTFWATKEVEISDEVASFSKEETIISNRYFTAKFEQLPQTREEVVLKTYELSICGSNIEHWYGDASSYYFKLP